MPGSAHEGPFCGATILQSPYLPLRGRSVARASSGATAFQLRGGLLLARPSPEYHSPQNHFRFGSPLGENHCRNQCESGCKLAYEASPVLTHRNGCVLRKLNQAGFWAGIPRILYAPRGVTTREGEAGAKLSNAFVIGTEPSQVPWLTPQPRSPRQ
jgi:hypothetical protein